MESLTHSLNAHRMKDVRLGDLMALTLLCARLEGVDMSGIELTVRPWFREGDAELIGELRFLSDSDKAALNINADVLQGIRRWSMLPWLRTRPYAPDDEFDERHVDDGPIATWRVPTDGHVDDAD